MKKQQFDQQFKIDAVKYYIEHKELGINECSKYLGIGISTLSKWYKQYRDNDETIISRGTGNYSSDEAKEIAKLKKELKDTQDALDILKKAISIVGK